MTWFIWVLNATATIGLLFRVTHEREMENRMLGLSWTFADWMESIYITVLVVLSVIIVSEVAFP